MRTWIKRITLACMIIQNNAAFSQEFTLPAFIDDITSCDIDLDGDADIICICQILNYDEDSIFIFYNNGESVFQKISYLYPNVNFILCDCVNEDSFPDIVSRYGTNIYFIPNYGVQGLGEIIPIMELAGTLDICNIVDVNQDNWNDLIYTHTSDEYWGIFINNGDLTFTNEIIQSGSSTTVPGVGFITNDSLPEIVLSYSAFDRTSVNLNNGNFNFTEVILEENFNYETPVMNLDNQGTDDFVLVNYATNKVALFSYIGNDQFELQSNFYASGIYGIDSFLADDFNQDGYDDFVIRRCNWYECTDSMYIYFNDLNWSFNLNQILYIGEWNWYKALAEDLNGDSFPDIIMKGYNGSNILALLWNDGNGNFSFENPVGIYDSDYNTYQLKVFPNPFHDYIDIEIPQINTAQLSVSIYDLYGKLVKNFTGVEANDSQHLSLNWDGTDGNKDPCPEGIYILTLRSNSDQISKKIIKY